MARKQKPVEHENHERWLVSYADFITLLFAFFVVMYSMSSVNEGKYRVLSDSMVAAFTQTTRSLTPIQVGELVRSPANLIKPIQGVPEAINISTPVVLIKNVPDVIVDPDYVPPESDESAAITAQINGIATGIEDEFEKLISANQVSVRKSPFWLEVVFNSNILFASASAELAASAVVELQKLATLLGDYPNQISVEGFTDNVPIVSPVFPSNWELSSARAAAVVRLFEDYGIASERLTSVGFGENRPVSDNSTEAGRASNRRVVIVIMAELQGVGIDGEVELNNTALFRQRTN